MHDTDLDPCLERIPSPGIRPHVRPNRTVHRQMDRDMRPIGQFTDEGDMTPLANTILRRIRNNRHTTGAGSYVLGDKEGHVYVVAEESSTGERFIRKNEAWTVGRYCAGLRGATPMIEQLIGDLVEHFRGLKGGVAA